jgi:uncharacterized membrane protein
VIRFLALVLFAIIPAAAYAGPSEDCDSLLTPEVNAQLEKGEVVVFKKGTKDTAGASQGFGRVLAIIERPKEDVWNVLIDHKEHPKYSPHLASVEIYYQQGNEIGIKETIKLLFKTYSYHCIQTLDKEAGVITWRLDKTKQNSIKDTTGGWYIRPIDQNRSLVMYTLSVDSGLFFPKVAEDFLFNRDLPNIVQSLKKHLEATKK